jgi:hypothetical protein
MSLVDEQVGLMLYLGGGQLWQTEWMSNSKHNIELSKWMSFNSFCIVAMEDNNV